MGDNKTDRVAEIKRRWFGSSSDATSEEMRYLLSEVNRLTEECRGWIDDYHEERAKTLRFSRIEEAAREVDDYHHGDGSEITKGTPCDTLHRLLEQEQET